MATAVAEGATLQCTCGSKPSQLLVTSQNTVRIDQKLAATVDDKDPMANVAPFGDCKSKGGPCMPAFAAPWAPGSTSTAKIGKGLALLSTDKLKCTAAPGVISVCDAGQTNTYDT